MINNVLLQMMYGQPNEPAPVINRALKFTGQIDQSAYVSLDDNSNLVTLHSNFEVGFDVRLTGFANQYIAFVGGKFSIIYGYVTNKFELYHEDGLLPRSQFATSVSDSGWHNIKLFLSGGECWAAMDGVEQFRFTTSADVNCLSRIRLGGLASDVGLGHYEIDNLYLKKDGLLAHNYDFNEAGSTLIDSVSGANMGSNLATKIIL